MTLHVREMTQDEVDTLSRWAQSRTDAARTVERARIIWRARQGRTVPAIARDLHLGQDTVRLWLKRFNAEGLAGLADRPRSGAPPTYTPDEVGLVIATSLTEPQAVGRPFGCWTLDRLVAYLTEEKTLPIKRSRVSEILIAEGLRWRTQETWFGDRAAAPRPPEEAPGEATASPGDGADAPAPGERPLDTAFAQKRGPS